MPVLCGARDGAVPRAVIRKEHGALRRADWRAIDHLPGPGQRRTTEEPNQTLHPDHVFQPAAARGADCRAHPE